MTARLPLALVLLAFALAAPAAEKTLYKCASPDGSIAFQENPCTGKALDVIPIEPAGAPPKTLDDPICAGMARELWQLNGTVEHTDFSEAGRQQLADRTAMFRSQCGATLERSQLAMECAVLGGALAYSGDPSGEDKISRVRAQHAQQCNDAAVATDIRRHAKAVR